MSWQFFLTVSILTTVAVTLIQRFIMRSEKSNPIAYVILLQLLGGFFAGCYALFRGFNINGITEALPNVLLMPFIWAGANYLLLTAIKYIEASEFSIVFASRVLWTIVAAMIFLREPFSIKQLVGTFFIIASVLLVLWQKHKIQINKGTIFALIGSFLFGIGLVNDSFIVRNVDVPSYFTVAFLTSGILLWMIFPKATKDILSIFKEKTFFVILLLSFFTATTALTYFWAYQIGRNAAQLASLNQISTILTVLLAAVLLKEKSNVLKKILAAIASFIGVVLVH